MMLDDYVMEIHSEEYYDYVRNYDRYDTWADIEYHFCQEVGLERECYED
jgi:hypothetical protein